MQINENDKKYLAIKVPSLKLADSLYADKIQPSMLPVLVNGGTVDIKKSNNPNLVNKSMKVLKTESHSTHPPALNHHSLPFELQA